VQCGIDLGSRSVKVVLMDGDKLVHSAVFETVKFYRQFGKAVNGELRVNFKSLGFTQVDQVVATGYGRNTLAIAGAAIIPELKAHMLGARFQTGLTDFTLLDLGGQDSKVVKVRKGKMVDFQTNDKCAASTGRYLENMAVVLNITLEELGGYSANPVQLNATCAIFGESELIGCIVEGYSTAELAAGVNHSIVKRIRPMLIALKSPTVVFTGGVAFGTAIAKMIEAELGIAVIIPPHPQLNGAIGCAVYDPK
jgi:predicted CoA-substrate-specific enzyme activase